MADSIDWNALDKQVQAQNPAAAPPAAPPAASPSPAAPAASSDGTDWDALDKQVQATSPNTAPDAPPTDATGNTGALSNAPDDSWASGAAKGAVTGAIQGGSHILGQVGDLHDLARLLMGGAASWFDPQGRSASQIAADMKANDAKYDPQIQAAIPGLSAIPGTDSLPNSDQVAAPIFAKTGQYTPTSGVGKVAQAAVSAVAGGIGPGGGAAALERAAPAAIGRGIASSLVGAAKQAAPMVTTNAIAGAAGQAVQNALPADNPYAPYLALAAGAAVPMATDAIKTAGGNYFHTAGNRDVRTGQALLDASDNPSAAMANLSKPNPVADVPGVALTTAEQAQDKSLLGVQRQMRLDDPASFANRDQDNNSAILNAAGNSNGDMTGANPMAPSDFVNLYAQHMDNIGRAATDQARTAAQNQAAAIGPKTNPERIGATIQDIGSATDRGMAKGVSTLYDAVDPNQSLVANTSNVNQHAIDTVGGMSRFSHPMSDDETRLFNQAGSEMGATTPYRDLVEFDKSINAALPDAKGPSINRLRNLKDQVQQSLNGTVDDAARTDPGVQQRLAGLVQDGGANRPEAPIADDTEVTQRPTKPSVPEPQNLHQFIRSLGGVQDPGGDLAAAGHTPIIGQGGGIIAPRGRGLGPDAVRQVAAEAGYLGADTDHAMANTSIQDLHNAIGPPGENRTFSVHDDDAAHQHDLYQQALEQYNRTRGPASQSGVRQPAAPIDAYSSDASASQANINGSGGAQRLAAAKAAHIQRMDFQAGPLGKVIDKPDSYRYGVHASDVPGRAVQTGPGGYEAAKGFIDSSFKNPDVINGIKNTVLDPLRSAALMNKDGVVTQQAYNTWKQNHSGTLRAISEVDPSFANRFDSAPAATNEMLRMDAATKQAKADFQANAASKLMGKSTPSEAKAELLSIMGDQKTGPSKVQQLTQLMKRDPTGEALPGLQKLFLDSLHDQITNTAAKGTSSDRAVSNAKVVNLIRKTDPTMRVLFPDGKVPNMMHSIANALDYLHSEDTGTRVSGASPTAKDQRALLQKIAVGAGGGSHGTAGLIAYEVAMSAFEHGVPSAAAGLIPLGIGKGIKSIQAHGMGADSAQLRMGMEDPKVGLKLMQAAYTKTPAARGALSAAARRALIVAPIIHRGLSAAAS